MNISFPEDPENPASGVQLSLFPDTPPTLQLVRSGNWGQPAKISKIPKISKISYLVYPDTVLRIPGNPGEISYYLAGGETQESVQKTQTQFLVAGTLDPGIFREAPLKERKRLIPCVLEIREEILRLGESSRSAQRLGCFPDRRNSDFLAQELWTLVGRTRNSLRRQEIAIQMRLQRKTKSAKFAK